MATLFKIAPFNTTLVKAASAEAAWDRAAAGGASPARPIPAASWKAEPDGRLSCHWTFDARFPRPAG
jgi:hypothetical protein